MTYFDFKTLDFIHKLFECNFADFIMPKITTLGNGGFIWLFIAFLLLFSKKHRKNGIVLIITLAAGAILGSLILKPLIARPRPCHINGELPMIIKIPTDYSFPSGHTLSSVSSAFILWQTDKRLGGVGVILAILIAFSRLYLYVHFPSDVLAGAIFGIIIAYFSARIFKIYKKN